MEDDKKTQLMKKKIQYFFDLGKKIHIILQNRQFLNGSIKEIRTDFILLEEDLNGEMPVFFLEMWNVEAYEPIKEEKKNG